MISKKIDERLKKVIIECDGETPCDCLVYVNNFQRVKYFIKEECFGYVSKEFPFINALACSICPEHLNKLATLDCVHYISSQSTVTALNDVAKKILFDDCRIKLTGNSINICFIDTGINRHLDFSICKNKILRFLDLCNDEIEPYDDNGHGTFVSGVACGTGIVSNGKYSGVAPNANIISIKALNSSGEATASKILEAMQWVYDNQKQYNIKIVCMSFGSEPLGLNDPIMKGAEALWRKGVTIVAAAGNSGPKRETIKSPGISNRIITVGGLNDNRFGDEFNSNFFEIAEFSSRGPAMRVYKPDIVAPAVDIISCNFRGGYTSLSGTSVATPMVAGIVALMLEYKPGLKPDSIKKILLSSCKPICFNRNMEGFGYPSLSNVLKKLQHF